MAYHPVSHACRPGFAVPPPAAAPGIAERFRFVGWIEPRKISAYFRLSDLVVMPSEYEAQALVYLEAQATGRVLVASDVPGAREVVVHGKTGLLFRVGDVEDLAEKILRAAGDPELRASIARRARRRVEGHSLDRVVAAYERVLRRVVQRSARAPRSRRS